MRHFTMALALAAAPALASAQQLQAGTVQITGGSNLSLGSSSLDFPDGSGIDTTTRNLGLEAFVYASPNLGLGLSAAYEYQQQDDGLNTARQQTTVLGPAVTLHVGTEDPIAFYLTGSLGRMSMNFGGGVSGSGWGFSAGGGLKVFPARFLSVDLGLEYASHRVDVEGVDLRVSGTLVKIGLSVYLNR
jgi:hypothetical protein